MQLLKRTILSYFIFSVILLMMAIPVFYYALKTAMIQNVDENLIATKTRIIPQLKDAIAGRDHGRFNFSEYDVTFGKEPPNKNADSIYNNERSGIIQDQSLPGRSLASHFFINQESYSLLIRTSMVDKIALIKRIVIVLAIILLVLLLGLLVINRMLTKKIWQPFYATLHRLRDYRVDSQGVLKPERSSITEFNDLNKAIESLTERNYQAYISQKEFAENASHEMQSPLSVLQSKLELLMQTRPLSEEQAIIIESMANASKRMSRLNKSLILLTRIENNQFLEKEKVSVREVLQKLIQQYELPLQTIRVYFDDGPNIVVEANRTLTEVLLGNLLSNAIRHNVPDGFIEITLKDQSVTISNSGKSSPLETEKIFQRFHKESGDSNSIGLGLEIVQKICTLNHYSIQYNFTGSRHVFTLRF